MQRVVNFPRATQACQLITATYDLFEKGTVINDGFVTADGEYHRLIHELTVRPDSEISPQEIFALVTETLTTFRINARGVDSFPDWITAARIALVSTEYGGRVTAGVEDLAIQLFEQISHLYIPPDKAVILEGHSLGAAVITRLATLMLRADEIYPIGGPKFADAEFAEKYNREFGDRTYRVVNLSDEVPQLPPDIPGVLELNHVCPAIEFTDYRGNPMTRHALTTYDDNIRRLA